MGGPTVSRSSTGQADSRWQGCQLVVHERLDAADVVRAIALVTRLGSGDDLDPVSVAAPAAAHLVDLLFEGLGTLYLGGTGEIHVPVLPRAGAAYDVEAGEVAAVSAAPPVVLVGEREGHAPRVSRGRSGDGTQPAPRACRAPRCRTSRLASSACLA